MFGRDAPGLFLCRSAHYLEICFNGFGQSKISASHRRATQLNAATRRSTPSHAGFDELEIDWGPDEPFGPNEDAQRDADREAEVQSLRSRVTELERRLSQLEAENAQLRSRDYSLQLA